ncbi:DUF484 family protein [Pusillimonas sp. CC-YST705]|uniref:DUF484 family protein n=1 Tax=Mesopusillimonas faecipullorum TaxID=2755040 RepID=A0ABS8CE56_9BURK|nr:DUF484 family protein [Mesopusillimonas faecipullorum]MCB5364321.1 DUF484 family protein [Mesopusillimonas faecipullorum]
MSSISLNAADVAAFLQQNPGFFQDHAELFADLKVPHPHATQAISLGERQILTLRAKAKDLEWQLSSLVHNATGNERIARTLTDWCALMLAEDDATRLPHTIVEGLQSLFELPAVTLRLWNLPRLVSGPYTLEPDAELLQYAQALTKPYCGPAQAQAAAAWLEEPTASMTVIALGSAAATQPFGLLVIGSDDPERFTTDMGTAFLESLGQLASAALSRLKQAELQED